MLTAKCVCCTGTFSLQNQPCEERPAYANNLSIQPERISCKSWEIVDKPHSTGHVPVWEHLGVHLIEECLFVFLQ